MAVCDYQELIDAAPCYVAQNAHLQLVTEVAMLCNLLDKIVNAGETTCDIDELIEQGACFVPLPDYLLQGIKLQLLCEISQAL